MLTTSEATGTGRTGVGMGSVVEGTNPSGPGMGKGSGTTRTTGERVGTREGVGIGLEAGEGVEVGEGAKVGQGVKVGWSITLAVVEEIGRSVAISTGELRGAEAIAALAGGSANNGRPTAHPTITTSRNNIPSAGSPVTTCCAPHWRWESSDERLASCSPEATPGGGAAARRHAHFSAA